MLISVLIQSTFICTFLSYLDDYYFLIAKCFEGVSDHLSYCNIFSHSRGAEDKCFEGVSDHLSYCNIFSHSRGAEDDFENKIFFFRHTCQIIV